VSIYSNTETSLAMSTLAVWCRVVQSRDVRSRVISRLFKVCTMQIHRRKGVQATRRRPRLQCSCTAVHCLKSRHKNSWFIMI